ncbi:hypothetical protein BY996DRAFT_4581159 [Phakopsora pachyrhizi]|nr:hypothetical protein BY996DRAFT_4581159 [Phakopsora pachyrhizi]
MDSSPVFNSNSDVIDPVVLGVLSNIILASLFSAPLLFIFFRARSKPSSFTWRTVYVPRTWWPPDPSRRTHKIFDRLPGNYLPSLIFQLLIGKTPKLINQKQPYSSSPSPSSSSSTKSETISSSYLEPSKIFTDEEIHLRFLALCLRLTLLALILGLPLYLKLFIHQVPLTPESINSSSLENFTILRLLHSYDLNPTAFSTNLLIWAIASILVGSACSFVLILAEWIFLKKHIDRFLRDRCCCQEIVYLPYQKDGGFRGFGERKMVNWIRACGLGPVGAEGSGEAIKEFERSGSDDKFRILVREANIRMGYAHLTGDEENNQFSQQRDLIIQGVFTISRLDDLSSLAEERRQVLNELELNEATYVAGFKPEDEEVTLPGQGHQKIRGANRMKRRTSMDDYSDSLLTPFGPRTLYQLEPQLPPERLDLNYGDARSIPSNSKLNSFNQMVISDTWTNSNNNSSSTIKKKIQDNHQKSSSVYTRFKEINQDLNLSNETYQNKWAIGSEVTLGSEGKLLVTMSEAKGFKAQSSTISSPDGLGGEEDVIIPLKIQIPQRPPPSLTNAPSQSYRALSQASLDSTSDSNRYPPSSTAPTSAILDGDEVESKFRDIDLKSQKNTIINNNASELNGSTNDSQPQGLTDNEMIVESSGITRGSNFDGAKRLRSILSLDSSSEINQSQRNAATNRIERTSLAQKSANPELIKSLFEVPLTIETTYQNPNFYNGNNHHDRTEIPLQPMLPTPSIKKKKSNFHAFNSSNSTPNTPNQNITPRTPGGLRSRRHRFKSLIEVKNLYDSIRKNRSQLKRLNKNFMDEKTRAIRRIEDGGSEGDVCGWILVGKGVGLIRGSRRIEGMTREDIKWENLVKHPDSNGTFFWIIFFILVVVTFFPASVLSMSASLDVSGFTNIFDQLQEKSSLILGLVAVTIPSIFLILVFFISLFTVLYLSNNLSALPSRAGSQRLSVKASLILIYGCFIAWFTISGSISNSIFQINSKNGVAKQIANSISIVADFLFGFECLLSILVPAIVLAQPKRWFAIRTSLRSKQTPRQRVLSLWPDGMDAVLSRSSTLMIALIPLIFSPIAPLSAAPSFFFFLFMICIQQRNVRSIYRRGIQSGGKTELTMVLMLPLSLVFQSGLVGFILISRGRWALAALSFIVSLSILFLSILMDKNSSSMMIDRKDLKENSRKALKVFESGPNGMKLDLESIKSSSNDPSRKSNNNKLSAMDDGSTTMASVLKLVNSALETEEIVPRKVPLPSESIDDLIETRLALSTYPDAPPYLPNLPWTEEKKFLNGEVLYPPVLLQDSLAVWLPKDEISEEEAKDLQKYWGKCISILIFFFFF